MSFIKRILDFSDKIFEYIAMTFIVLMTLIITLQVVTRYCFSMTPRWSEEVALILMVWFGFMGIAIGVKKGIHISIEYFVSLCPPSIQKVLMKINDIIVGIFGLMLVVYGIRLVKVTGTSTLPATQWPGYILYFMVPVSGAMIVCYCIAKLFGIEPDDKIINLKNKNAK
ncbi:TRAP transporter small permease [Paramaledivibacter caminithermalis]|uniref:TRAP-type C4-dicarboxylate transport system, small permease component n=1 Tax=Paramaledivibacter caminithermalis (strain DSM 15212 / CIP 107654 / DViRD3) TaxID=1121301 RepID=A0A1M6NTH5_PARC5|nr:TRAP transporter small permease [Paramaledivibacter caminithermalis]SHJ99027.1 TRAP-type C4-dicarboxylate transport system, small permease component [Paramaledivibacter caminithermalis DSM 15212]